MTFLNMFTLHTGQMGTQNNIMKPILTLTFTLHSGQIGTLMKVVILSTLGLFTLHSGQIGTNFIPHNINIVYIVHTPLRSDRDSVEDLKKALQEVSSHSTQVR